MEQGQEARLQNKIYTPSLLDGPIRQGEIFSNLTQIKLDLDTIDSDKSRANPVTHPFAIVVSQDCDLDWDYDSRKHQANAHRRIPSILFCEVDTANNMAKRIMEIEGSKNTDKSRRWSRIRVNKDERYQFLQKIIPEQDALEIGIEELTIDFKRYFTIPSDEIYVRIKQSETKRRCRLLHPYLEHFASRFYYFQSRIALPEEHFSDPDKLKFD